MKIINRFIVKNLLLFSGIFSFPCYAGGITILTQPVNRDSSDSWYHPAVTNSLLRGLKNLQADFNYNPSQEKEVRSTVVVLCNMDALQQAIKWKKSGRIKKLLAGPNLVTSPLDAQGVILSPYIDRYMVNSKWTKTAYLEDAPALARNIAIWPAGVDPLDWKPTIQRSFKQNKVLVYWKTESEDFCKTTEETLKRNGWDPVRIQYGTYNKRTFKKALDSCSFAVFISRSESQGIALAEAWAMDVPTLVWNPQELTINKRKYSESSACPYLTSSTGLDWKYFQEFEQLLQDMPRNLNSFEPRKWVLEHMSDAASAQILLSIIGSI